MLEKFKNLNIVVNFLDVLLISFLFIDIGFVQYDDFIMHKLFILPSFVFILLAINFYKYFKKESYSSTKKRAQYNLVVLLLVILIDGIAIIFNYQDNFTNSFYETRVVLEYGLLVYYFIQLTFLMRMVYSLYFNPFVLFVGSFAIVILTGTFFLMLPSATIDGINFRDALFTSTSAVCVTGLLAADTATDFTLFGQTIMMVLIQLGGLGMLTFTTFFAFFFKSGSSVKESLFMKNVLGDEQLSNVMQTTFRIVVFSVLIEAVGAILIYDSIRNLDLEYPVFFSIFHAVSAYCNGGFSTMPGNLQNPALQFNYYLQWIIMILIIFGGLGYFISFNFMKYIRQFWTNLFFKRRKKSTVRMITLNTKIVVYTTACLIIGGSLAVFLTEYQTVLPVHKTLFGKVTTSTFAAVTARTTGFSTVDFMHFSTPGILIMILLMWIGASPASTGGGIKTSSFALAVLNIFSIARNKDSIEIGTRQVAPEAVKRAFAIIMVSLVSIGVGILLILIFDPQFSLLEVAFEVFSAFGTVGLSMGITDDLSPVSEYVLIVLMFIGRIGLINLMSGLLRQLKTRSYTYPQENILIN